MFYYIYKKEIKIVRDENDILKQYMKECNNNIIEFYDIFKNQIKEGNNNLEEINLLKNQIEEGNNNLEEINKNIRHDMNFNNFFYQKQLNALKEKNIINSILINYQFMENIDLNKINHKIIEKDNKIIISYITNAKLSKIYTKNLMDLSPITLEDIANKVNLISSKEILLNDDDDNEVKKYLRNIINRNQDDLTLLIEHVELIIDKKNKTYQVLKRSFNIRKPLNDNRNKFNDLIKNINNPNYYIESKFNIHDNNYYVPFIFTNGNNSIIQVEHYERILSEKDLSPNYYCNCLNAKILIKEQYMSKVYKGVYYE
jgi:hypothetical protein